MRLSTRDVQPMRKFTKEILEAQVKVGLPVTLEDLVMAPDYHLLINGHSLSNPKSKSPDRLERAIERIRENGYRVLNYTVTADGERIAKPRSMTMAGTETIFIFI